MKNIKKFLIWINEFTAAIIRKKVINIFFPFVVSLLKISIDWLISINWLWN